jgi:hypothetical protein
MRLKLVPLVLGALCALGLAPGAGAQLPDRQLEGEGSALSLVDGRGTAVVRSRSGSLLGTVRRGRIVVVDRADGPKTTVRLWGCEERRRPSARKTVCIGRGLHVSVLNGRWITTLRGRGINASAVVEGRLRIRGSRGTFSIDGVTRSWPPEFRTYVLG